MADDVLIKNGNNQNVTLRGVEVAPGVVAPASVLVKPDGTPIDMAAALDAIRLRIPGDLGDLLAALVAGQTGQAALLTQLRDRFPAVAALADDTANPSLSMISSLLMGWDGANWDRLKTSQGAVATVADGFARTVASDTLVRQNNTTAYAAGRLIGGSATAGFDGAAGALNGFTFANFARTPGGVVQVDALRLYKSKAVADGYFRVLLFRAKPVITIGDTGAIAAGVPVGSAAAAARLVGRFDFDMTAAEVGSDGAEFAAVPVRGFPIKTTLPAGASDLFALLYAVGAYGPLAAEQISLVAEGFAY